MHKDDGAELLLAVKMMSFQWLLARYNSNLGVNDVFISNVDISHEYLQEIYKIKGEKVKVKNLKKIYNDMYVRLKITPEYAFNHCKSI